MFSFLKKYSPGYLPAFLWLIFSTYLFCSPGSGEPKYEWLIQINFDKLVHFGIFSVQVFLTCWGYRGRNPDTLSPTIPFLLFTSLAIVFGVVIEFLQDGYIPNRSFQVGDIVADTLGSVIGCWISVMSFYKK
jgi:VanZ family protein